ncbi:MAG TPA: peptide deformylase [Vitreimonas sp.]|nr:peptide deformylase [Vitreimonas sp.]
MQIITAPHSTLRTPAQPVTEIDKKVLQFISELSATLTHQVKPQGVGLAAPQVDKKWRMFVTNITDDKPGAASNLQLYINPVIVKQSPDLSFGDEADGHPALEGCLSIPKIYGPIPRRAWVELEYQTLTDDKLVSHSERFVDFTARVIQHELDHLDGILFTDYSLEYDLPVYTEPPRSERLIELEDRSILEIF